jgi:photosystem II stability/assembly factor-like uncharacterized protein
LAVGDKGTILRTGNGGASWSKTVSGVTEDLHGVDFADEKTAFAVGAGGVVLRSVSGGLNWEQIESGARTWLEDVKFLDERRA